jgi:hypothetical protein
MSSDKSLVGGEGSVHDELIGEELEALHAEIDAIHSDLSSTAERHEDGEEITAATGMVTAANSAVRINVYENIPFAGGDGDYSILSVLFGAHSIGEGIFGYLTMRDSNKVRVQCVECRDAVMDFPWMDVKSRIRGSVKAWRAAFPCARAVNVAGRRDIVDADFVHIRGDARARLHTVNMGWCNSVTDAAFVYLRGIHTLDMSLYWDIGGNGKITDAAFVNLRGIHTLDMSCCDQRTITDAAFLHLRGIHTLKMFGCSQDTITDAAFVHLRGIHSLDMRGCCQNTITNAAFIHLRGIHTLDMSFCDQDTITGSTFTHLRGIHNFTVDECSATIQAAAAALLALPTL